MDKLALIDSKPLTRICVSQLLEESMQERRRSEDFTILPFSSTDELLTNFAGNCDSLGLVIFNIGAACVKDNKIREDIFRLKQELFNVPLIILSERDDPHCILDALRYGIHSYILTDFNPSTVIQALRLILAGGRFIPASALSNSLDEEGVVVADEEHQESPKPNRIGPVDTLTQFTPRQLEVLQLLRKGKSNKIIAYELKMQESTVKVHVRQIMKKLRAINRTHAAFLASQIGLMEPENDIIGCE
jgi:DNA-binding NarL/FixJ family response regulator